MKNAKVISIAFQVLIAVFFSQNTAFAKSYKSVYDSLIFQVKVADYLLTADNLEGHIIWRETPIVESLLNMYEKTRDVKYLDYGAKHVATIMKKENLLAGRPDSDGVMRRGWQTGAHYTFSLKDTLYDENGSAFLEIQGIRRADNNFTTVEFRPTGDAGFTLVVKNDKNKYTKEYDDLTVDNVEGTINQKIGFDSYLVVRKLGKSIAQTPITKRLVPQRVTLTTFHTPKILSALIRFVVIVREAQLAEYQPLADELSDFAREIVTSYDNLWNKKGYIINHPKLAYAFAGVEVPFNILADHGRCYLYMYLVTQDEKYLKRLDKISDFIFKSYREKDGKLIIPYAYGKFYSGWTNCDKYHYRNHSGSKHLEDNSHYTAQIMFIYDMMKYEYGYIDTFRDKVLTLLQQSLRQDGISYYIDGSGDRTFNPAAGFYILLTMFDPALQQACERIVHNLALQDRAGTGELLPISNVMLMRGW